MKPVVSSIHFSPIKSLSFQSINTAIIKKDVGFDEDRIFAFSRAIDSSLAKTIEKDRKKDNQIVFNVAEPIRKDPNRGMRFVNCSEPINKGRLGHSKTFLYKANKTYKYYD